MNSLWNTLINSCDADCVVRSLALGCSMAFSPLLFGLQFPVVFLLSRYWRINKVFVLGLSYTINNPLLTMIPIMIGEYFVGYFIVRKWLDIDLSLYDSAILDRVTQAVQRYLGPYLGEISFSIWYYLLGSVLTSVAVFVVVYCIARYRFVPSRSDLYENNSAK